MPPKTIIALIAGLAIIASAAGAVVHHLRNQVLEPPGVQWRPMEGVVNVVLPLPENVLNYTSAPLPVLEEELQMLPPDTSFGRRRYFAPDGGYIDLSIVLMGGDQSSIHRPQSCIPSQGWTVLKEDTDSLQIRSPSPYEFTINRMLNSKSLIANGEELKAHSYYLYWFVSRDEITHSRKERILSLAGKMLTSGSVERWAYVSVFTAFPPGYEGPVYERMTEFIEAAAPHIHLVEHRGGAATDMVIR